MFPTIHGLFGASPQFIEPAWTLHLDANLDTYESNGGAASTDGNDVGYWLDQSGAGNHVQQTTAAKKPHLFTNVQNGLSVVRGDGADDAMGTIANMNLTSFTITCVVIARTMADRRILYHWTGSNGWFFAPTGLRGFWHITPAATAYVDVPIDTACVYTLIRDASAGQITIRQNGVTIHTANLTVPTTNAVLWFYSALGTGSYGHVDIGEVKLIDSVVDTGDIAGVEAAMASKWGIAMPDIFWYMDMEADSGVYESDGGAASINDAVVGYWENKANYNAHLIQATAANKPILKTNVLNSHPVIRGDGVNDNMGIANNMTLVQYTVVLVLVARKAASDGRIVYQFDGGVGRGFFTDQGELGVININGNSVPWNPATDHAAIVVATFANGTLTVRRNGEVVNTAVLPNPKTHHWARVFAWADPAGPSKWSKVDIAVLRIAPYILTGSQISTIESALSTKYGIALDGDTHFPPVPLVTPTYDGSGQAMHPAVVDVGQGNVWPSSGSPQHRYWMAMTPYTASNAQVENPSILVSDDLITWTVPTGLTNPIEPSPAGGAHNADTELILYDNKLYCFWIDNAVGGYNMNVRSSVDGIDWGSKTVLFSGSYATSPTVFYDGSQFVMIYVDAQNRPFVLRYRTCATPDGTWSSESSITLNGVPSGTNPWNISARRLGADDYLAIIHFSLTSSGSGHTGGGVWWTTSTNGTVWDVGKQEIVTGDYATILFTIYQSCFVAIDDEPGSYWLYFSGAGSGVWRTSLRYVVSI
jgi:hypothetical protein